MALSPYEHLRLCSKCNGRAYHHGVGCEGSGFENATAREAFEREHRQGAEPLLREEDDPRAVSLLP